MLDDNVHSNSDHSRPFDYEADRARVTEFTKILERGWAHAEKGYYDSAIAAFTSLIDMNPDYGEAYYNRGEAYADKGEYDKAIADYTMDIDLGDIYCCFARGLAYAKIGKKSEAIVDFDVIVRLSKDPELIPRAKQEIKKLLTA